MNRFARFAASALALSLVPAMLMGCGVTLALRICAAVFRWSLPKA